MFILFLIYSILPHSYFLISKFLMPLCQVDTCLCNSILPMRGNSEICVGCKHPIAVHIGDSESQFFQPSGKLLASYPNDYFLINYSRGKYSKAYIINLCSIQSYTTYSIICRHGRSTPSATTRRPIERATGVLHSNSL